ncbi:MAG: metallophosphoesterase [archaeon]
MKILAIGDFHGKFPVKLKKLIRKENADLILCTGDYGGSDKLLKIIFKYFDQGWWNIVGKEKAQKYILEDYNSGKRIINELNKIENKIYMINGNWDFTSLSKAEKTSQYLRM